MDFIFFTDWPVKGLFWHAGLEEVDENNSATLPECSQMDMEIKPLTL